MSEFVAVGPARDLDGPLPLAPPHHSLLQDRRLMGEGRDAASGNECLNGVNVWGYPDGLPGPVGAVLGRDVPREASGLRLAAAALRLLRGLPGESPAPRSRPAGPEDLRGEGRASARRHASPRVEEALAEGVAGSSNPFFGDANVDVVGGGSESPRTGALVSWRKRSEPPAGRGCSTPRLRSSRGCRRSRSAERRTRASSPPTALLWCRGWAT